MIQLFKKKTHETKESVKNAQAKSAQKGFMEELFNDYYLNRRKVYKMNFIRGLLFGFGSVLGGTVVLALVVWLLTLFVELPLIGESVRGTVDTLQRSEE